MKIIMAVLANDLISPSEPIPATAIRTVYDGINYIVYEDGDEPPPEPIDE